MCWESLYCGSDLSIFEATFLLVYTNLSRTCLFSPKGRNCWANHLFNLIEFFVIVINFSLFWCFYKVKNFYCVSEGREKYYSSIERISWGDKIQILVEGLGMLFRVDILKLQGSTQNNLHWMAVLSEGNIKRLIPLCSPEMLETIK